MKQDERGMGHVETALIVVVVVIIGFVGWFVYRAKHNADQALNTANTTSIGAAPRFAKNKNTAATNAGTTNASLQSDLQAATSSANQGSKDISTTNNSLSDQSTFTSVPQ
jgi:uncharacterized protein HemX